MKISIITATYNSEKTIESCLKSVASQDYSKIEHIIIDGNSNDKTCNLICEYIANNPTIKYITEPDKGIYDALNKGVERSTGDIIGFLHSDDEFQDDKTISKIAHVFKIKNPDGVYGDLNYVNADDSSRIIRHWKSKPFEPNMLLKGWMPPHPTLFIKKEVYEKHGNFNLSYKIAADYDFILRVFNDKDLNLKYIPRNITKMRIGGASSKVKNLIPKMQEDIRALKDNSFSYPFWIMLQKNLSKIPQFFK